MLKILVGDLFASRAQTLVNAVNCVEVMGKGLALEFKKRFPQMFEDYVERWQRDQVRLGEPYIFRDRSGIMVMNFATKDHWRSSSRLIDIEHGLDYFVDRYADWGVSSVAFPALGCGYGGLAWADVEPVMVGKLRDLPIAVEVYAPHA
jgi:O-acetyl-ADP-ribose deacetylase (regulator of RNase III)